MKNVDRLKELAEGTKVLYVEDNEQLRTQAQRLLGKFFQELYVAEDGLDGLQQFKKHQPKIIITDIRMPNLDGFEMAEKILALNPNVTIIITTAHDEKEYLHKGINFGVFRYLKKPLVIEHLIDALLACLERLEVGDNARVFDDEITKIFNYQNNLLVLLKKGEPVYANPKFYDFFEVDDMSAFKELHSNLGNIFEEQKGFLYTQLNITWYDQILNAGSSLFHTKICDRKGEYHHFILNAHVVPDSENEFILSFDDVTELGMMGMFEKKSSGASSGVSNIKPEHLSKLLQMVQNNNAKISMLNFYRGLTITNDATVVDYKNSVLTLKTSFFQLKITRMEEVTTIRSEFFPKDIRAKCSNIDFDSQTLDLSDVVFVETSASRRKHVRVEPKDGTCMVRLNGKAYKTKIVDICMEALKVDFPLLPPGIEEETVLDIAVELPLDRPLQFRAKGKVLRVDKQKKSFYMVIMIKITDKDKKKFTDYFPKRQMELIREFKSMRM